MLLLFSIILVCWALSPDYVYADNSGRNKDNHNFDYLLPPETQRMLEEKRNSY